MQLNPDPTAQQQQVLVLLAQGKSINAAAEAVGIHRNTIANWRRSSESFRNHWHTMQYEQAMHWRDELQSIAHVAVDAILKTLTDEKTPASVRLRAALAVIGKVTTVPAAQPDLKPSRNLHNLAQAAQSPESEVEPLTVPVPQEVAAFAQTSQSAQSAQPCTSGPADVLEDLRFPRHGLDDLLQHMCTPPRMHNPAQSAPFSRPK